MTKQADGSRSVRAWVVATWVMLALTLAAAMAAAQGGRSEINGTIFDQDKAVVPGVTITVVNVETGIERTTISGPDGHFVVPTLQPGRYKVSVELAGFQPQTRDNVTLSVGQEASLDFSLQVGALTEEVTVTTEVPVVETTASRVGTNVSNEEIDNLPSAGRSQLSLMQTIPGLTPSLAPGTFEGGQFNANGRDTGSNLFMIDGVYNNDDRLGGSQGYQARVTLDTMAEYQVLTHQYTAEYGGSSGVVVNAVSKSGTNNLHGRGFYYMQDYRLNATDYFLKKQGEENSPSGSDVYGFNVGGPLARNKAFWFFNLERDVIDEAANLNFPPEAAPAAVNYSDATRIKALNSFLRLDYQLARNQNLSFRWLRESAPTVGEGLEDNLSTLDNVAIENDTGDQVFNFNWTAVLGGRGTNEFKVTHVRENLLQGNSQYFDGDLNFIELNGRDQFDVGSQNGHPDWTGGPRALHGSARIRTYAFDDSLTWFKPDWAGSHTFKTGVGYSKNEARPQIVGGNDNGTFSFLQNRPYDPANAFTYPTRFSIRLGEIYFNVDDWRVNWYAQDKWQATDHLTLNLGLRYDYQHITPQTKNALAPRVGAAYDVKHNGKMLIRGGVGKFYEYQLISVDSALQQAALVSPSFLYDTGEDRASVGGNIPANPCLQPTGTGASGLALISPACRALLTDVRNRVAAGGFTNSEPTFDGDRKLGYLWSFSLGYKQELMTNLAVSVDYVGNRGRDQTGLIDINEPRTLPDGRYGRPGVNVFDPNGELVPPQYRGATFQRVLQFQTRPEFNSDYNALELSMEKRYSQRWSGRVSYTYSKANDVGTATGGANISTKRVSDDLNPRSDYGRTNFDNRHAFAFSFYAQAWKGLGAGAVFRHYSGYPINELVGTDVNADRDTLDRPVKGVNDATLPIKSPLDSSGRAIRNGIDGEAVTILDLRFQYIFNLPRQSTLGLFWEIYNATDHVNFGNPTGNRRSSNFLVPVVAGDPRTMQLGIRYTF